MTSGVSGNATRCHALVTGGGTAGHVLPAIAIMDRLVRAGHPAESLHYVGTQRGIEVRLVADSPYPHTLLDVVGLQRSLSRRNLAFVPKLIGATRRARALIRERKPAVVVNVGGYASMPATLAARRCKVPVVVVSYDRRPGLASKLSARFAVACATAFPGSTLPNSRLTGAPIRPAILAVDRATERAAAREQLGVPPDRLSIVAFGGSLGAKAVNDAVWGLVELWSDRADIHVHHVVGDRWLTDAPPPRTGPAGIMYDVIGFDDRMPQWYAACDLMITRAGASTIAELAATGTPAIVVPWAGAAENHQLDNARTLTDIGAAILVEEAALSTQSLAEAIQALIDSPASMATIAAAAYAAGTRHRGDSLIELIDEVAAR
jgi:UDP-N-acetylglucosamine--N-acetylmuramyl-(pentapeptide) pyrophosphoryl-undecaprenol N-acetylglucosamine transferase